MTIHVRFFYSEYYVIIYRDSIDIEYTHFIFKCSVICTENILSVCTGVKS